MCEAAAGGRWNLMDRASGVLVADKHDHGVERQSTECGPAPGRATLCNLPECDDSVEVGLHWILISHSFHPHSVLCLSTPGQIPSTHPLRGMP